MLFNSYIFLFCFLPIFLLGWHFIAAGETRAGWQPLWALFGASLLFYAFWGLPYLALLLIMIGVNYFFGLAIAPASGDRHDPARRILFILGLIINLLPLIWFKYSWFIIRNMALALGANWEFTPPGLPLGISFYTFIQIAWLAGVYEGKFAPAGLMRHTVFSGCFAYVMSGPIVREEQIGWQLDNLTDLKAENLAEGFTLFTMGLAKKILLADNIGFYADAVFNAAEKGWTIHGLEAWLGSLCYAFQLYFDFSGYTDMALGIGLMIGLRLPENFNSPYKATGIIDFWRRWHITLSSWLKDFLYIPMGGNRKGRPRQYRNLFLTMLIGGIWHGAGWTYMLWGALHGAMLCVNHLYRSIIRDGPMERWQKLAPVRLASIAFTFLCLDLCWVVFRAFSLDGALAMYKAMFAGPWTTGAADGQSLWDALLPGRYFTGWQPLALLALCWIICWSLPNSHEIMRGQTRIKWLRWQPVKTWAIACALLAFASLALLSGDATFLYFQF